MDFWQYCWHFFGRAFYTPWQIAAYVTGALAIILGIIVWRNPQWEPTMKLLLWLVPLALFILITPISWVTTSYNIYKEAQQPKLDMETIVQALVQLAESNQTNTIKESIDEAIGIVETATGKPAFLIPIEDALTLGNVSQGSPQTFTGFTVDECPIFMNIQGLGYALIMINSVNDDTFEAVFMTNIVTYTNTSFKLILGIESQVVLSQIIPPRTTGFLIQKSRATIHGEREVDFGDMEMAIQIEAGVVE
jgi:hypothetical protein